MSRENPLDRPGHELGKIIPEWVAQYAKGCNCKDFARLMDNWGIEGCLANQDKIILHLMTQVDEYIPMVKVLPAIARKMACKSLLKMALRNARLVVEGA